MADGKKSFILYNDLIHTVKKLSDEQAGQLFKHILSYVNGEENVTPSIITEITFEPIRQQFIRDLEKYKSTCDRNKNNGSKGGRPKNPTEPKKPNGLFKNPTEPKKPDNDNDNDNDSGIDNVLESIKNLFDNKYINKTSKEIIGKCLKSYSEKEIIDAIKWAKSDSFWDTNFLSIAKLDKKNKDGVKYIDVFISKVKQSNPSPIKKDSLSERVKYSLFGREVTTTRKIYNRELEMYGDKITFIQDVD